MKKLFLIPVLTLGVALISCKKDEPNPPAPTSNLSSYFTNNLNDEKQSFTINASSYSEIIGANGVKLMIPANSFETSSGALATGTITISLIEILDQSKMILTGMPTTSNGSVLISGGQINVTATQGTSQVFLADGASISVMVPTSSPDYNMALFEGVVETDGDVNWIPSVNDTTMLQDSVIIVGDSTGGSWSDYYYFNWTDSTMGWINCDYFYYSSSALTTVTADLEDQFNETNTSVFFHFTDINSVAMAFYGGENFSAGSFPEGLAITVVCISEIDGNYYSAFVPVTISTNLVVPVTMNATTLTDIEAAINAL